MTQPIQSYLISTAFLLEKRFDIYSYFYRHCFSVRRSGPIYQMFILFLVVRIFCCDVELMFMLSYPFIWIHKFECYFIWNILRT